ncbi:Uncharacterized protein HZ326_8587 [Fusarium oxysporum f. sp. albedinis]|nr:Uncharacterized protein HZ326_8587 [Fusarium oxysporum f. sp. albedinis]
MIERSVSFVWLGGVDPAVTEPVLENFQGCRPPLDLTSSSAKKGPPDPFSSSRLHMAYPFRGAPQYSAVSE